ncbi:hypothetical protein CMV_026598 [Castanea mollissima]|uniref:Uncharacterized protein n=1 Tax=Castanea mollissima TaxID=60419 RepID=A0A8J4QAV5_9ROSI|nr:hypothetical protein CMV_026598 [Castanea mollissima]
MINSNNNPTEARLLAISAPPLLHHIIGYLLKEVVDYLNKMERAFMRSLNNPSILKGWRVDGGDPCEESRIGVSCSDSSVIHFKIQRLNLTGWIGGQLNNLQHLKHL